MEVYDFPHYTQQHNAISIHLATNKLTVDTDNEH